MIFSLIDLYHNKSSLMRTHSAHGKSSNIFWLMRLLSKHRSVGIKRTQTLEPYVEVLQWKEKSNCCDCGDYEIIHTLVTGILLNEA